LWGRRPGPTAFEVVPQAQLYPQAAPGDGLTAAYFDNIDLTGGTVSRVDPAVNFDWGLGPPAAGIGPDTFSARWTGQVLAVETGTYTFRTTSDDGVRLWVDGRLLVDDWTDRGPTSHTAAITLEAGRKYDITLEYFDDLGGATVRLAWKRPGQSVFTIIPQANLYSS